MVRTFILHVLPMTVDMFHGDTQPPLGSEQKVARSCVTESFPYICWLRVSSHRKCKLVSRGRRGLQVLERIMPQ